MYFYCRVLGAFAKATLIFNVIQPDESLKQTNKNILKKPDMCTLSRKCKGLCFSLVSLGAGSSADDGWRPEFLLRLSSGCRHGCLQRWLQGVSVTASLTRLPLGITCDSRPTHLAFCVLTHRRMATEPWRRCLSADICRFPPPESGRKLRLIEREKMVSKERKSRCFHSGLHVSTQAIINLK